MHGDYDDYNLAQFMTMIRSGKKCSFRQYMKLTKYGNWCGKGANGKPPIDPIDACCKSHDNCYRNVTLDNPKVIDHCSTG